MFCKAEKSKDVGDHWDSLQHKHHGKEMEVTNFSFECLSYFKICIQVNQVLVHRSVKNCKYIYESIYVRLGPVEEITVTNLHVKILVDSIVVFQILVMIDN